MNTLLTITILCAVFLYIALGLTTCCVFLLRKRPRRKPRGHAGSGLIHPVSFRYDRSWIESVPQEIRSIESYDGLQLQARMVHHPESKYCAVICHAYRAHSASMSGFAHLFFDMGCSVLMPDARAHGNSEGNFIGMGWKDRKDLQKWIDLLSKEQPDVRIILFGVSMGAAAIMNTVGEHLPDNVVCAIEDCGFSSIRDLMRHQLSIRHLPRFLLYAADPFCRLLSGFSVFNNNTYRSLTDCKIPMLFIHGTKDSFVPHSHAECAAQACSACHRILSVPGADHADCIITNPELYKYTISDFLKEYTT